MTAPKWFYAALAGCAMAFTLATAVVLLRRSEQGRYVRFGTTELILDSHTGEIRAPRLKRDGPSPARTRRPVM